MHRGNDIYGAVSNASHLPFSATWGNQKLHPFTFLNNKKKASFSAMKQGRIPKKYHIIKDGIAKKLF